MNYGASILDRLSASWQSNSFDSLIDKLKTYLNKNEIDEVIEAHNFSNLAHSGQKRLSGEDYISHPIAVATILAELRLDVGSIKAALLHDVLEDTDVTLKELENNFGNDIAALVDGVSKLDKLYFDSSIEEQAQNFRKMLLAMVKDLRVILVKLADRTHNMRTISALDIDSQKRIAKETLEIYAPIANRLGIFSIKHELEDLGFKICNPVRYRVLNSFLGPLRDKQKKFLQKIEKTINKTMINGGIKGSIITREKSLYSIYTKMKRKRMRLHEIVDIFAVRINVKDVHTCYLTLGIVHQLYKPMPGRFKDYIAIPRINGYQSLHTTLFGAEGNPLEVQIRTEEMDKLADKGVAAHWQYKASDKATQGAEIRARDWLSGLMEIQSDFGYEELIETVKVDLYPDNVYVFTPKGKILRLPSNSTVVDFAYAIHTDIGNRCIAAKVNRRFVPLRTVLENGETVEIFTKRKPEPNPLWVNFVITAKARNSIRTYLKHLKKDKARDLGRRLLSQALKPYSLNIRRLKKSQLEFFLKELKETNLDLVYEQLGLGERLAPILAGMLANQNLPSEKIDISKAVRPLDISGIEGLVIIYAKCCCPIPGDSIIGYMSSGRGMTVHRTSCSNVLNSPKASVNSSNWIVVKWSRTIKGEFQSEIQIKTMNRVGLLAEVASKISSKKSNINNVKVETDGDDSILLFGLSVRNRRHLANVLRSIRNNADVIRVNRVVG
ncbi:MAG: bifunctional (p)ppGpp synthetase/guanosine-3',5'-bis(diphosphate) 3'-pyrophosphohydrolase [Pseudomonadota bacterium]|nr:bifunctional GTP diphosphokinase/guanosine-3',5'-bis(diphosphate) 3'-diphosphatase [Gammaproteobacteria bacterium]MEE2684206.1 bifunctional (p)ppGpp synthetase/guanosine-3',5'-bis(diphosphate) 3'-pyrophosphohydrolase [Pseudomonadota bacterium]